MNLELIYDEKEKVWKEKPEPYITIEVETEDDYEEIKKALCRAGAESVVKDEDGVFCCPHCGDEDYLYSEFEYRNNYCGKCGQALDWEDEE